MKNFKQVYEQMIESLFFLTRKRMGKAFKNPEIREVYEDYLQRKRFEYNTVLDKELKNVKKLQESYEYKVYEHYKKLHFTSKNRSVKFLKYCKFDILVDKAKWNNRKFPIKFFDRPQDFMKTKFNYFIYFILAIIFFKLGFRNGKKDSIIYDVIKENVIDIRTEDQLFDILLRNNIPLLVLYYYPGLTLAQDMMFAMGDFEEKHGPNIVKMAKVNCKYNLDLCLKKSQVLKLPQWELMLQPYNSQEGTETVKKFPIIQSKMDRTLQGIEGFLAQQGVMDDMYSPIDIIQKAMNKY